VRWTKLGDESTKFFHAAATERYKNNIITSLDLEDGRMSSSEVVGVGVLAFSFTIHSCFIGITGHMSLKCSSLSFSVALPSSFVLSSAGSSSSSWA
jgi:hypothetical protein